MSRSAALAKYMRASFSVASVKGSSGAPAIGLLGLTELAFGMVKAAGGFCFFRKSGFGLKLRVMFVPPLLQQAADRLLGLRLSRNWMRISH
jgi:hypothetical protein